ncbi:MAG: ATP--guanido phosphotransferase, partial [Verrucomicrobiota bacterium]|nr:ATP--guanido phosphotransferase [Verrucomicrobiota bacterium]
ALTEELFIITQPAHLQDARAGKLSAEKRDILRANLLRDQLMKVNRPATPEPGKTNENGG